MRGYENLVLDSLVAKIGFRIPMRGYELHGRAHGHAEVPVPNPHEGL